MLYWTTRLSDTPYFSMKIVINVYSAITVNHIFPFRGYTNSILYYRPKSNENFNKSQTIFLNEIGSQQGRRPPSGSGPLPAILACQPYQLDVGRTMLPVCHGGVAKRRNDHDRPKQTTHKVVRLADQRVDNLAVAKTTNLTRFSTHGCV